ncbi:MAG: hypothetical protein CVT95_05980, partial [Bacteroidetes bacterium HGW-Bacteroidetes-12]
TFLNKASITKELDAIPENTHVVIDGSKSFAIAYDVLENIQEFVDYTFKLRNITAETKGLDKVKSISSH